MKTVSGKATANGQRKGIPNGWRGCGKTMGTKMCGCGEETTIYRQMNAEYSLFRPTGFQLECTDAVGWATGKHPDC